MHTRSGFASAPSWVPIFLLVGGVAFALLTRAGSGPGAGDATEIPADVLALGTDVRAASPEGKISAEEAVAAFEKVWGASEGGRVQTFLVTLTDPEVMLESRTVWVVKLSGVPVPFGIPDVPQGIPRPSSTAGDVLYSYVDALTGEWLVAKTP